MNYLLLIFRSRNDTLAMYRYFTSRGLSCFTVNAPRSLVKSCGLAIKTNVSQTVLSGVLSQCPFKTEVKVYAATQSFGGTNYRQIM